MDSPRRITVRERFKAAVSSQEGFIAGYWLRRPGGRMISGLLIAGGLMPEASVAMAVGSLSVLAQAAAEVGYGRGIVHRDVARRHPAQGACCFRLGLTEEVGKHGLSGLRSAVYARLMGQAT